MTAACCGSMTVPTMAPAVADCAAVLVGKRPNENTHTNAPRTVPTRMFPPKEGRFSKQARQFSCVAYNFLLEQTRPDLKDHPVEAPYTKHLEPCQELVLNLDKILRSRRGSVRSVLGLMPPRGEAEWTVAPTLPC